MGNENRRTLKYNIASIPDGNKKQIEIIRGAGKIGIEVIKLKDWKNNCNGYFNRYYKSSRFISVSSENDLIVSTLSQVCSEKNSRGFVFKNYNIIKHLEFCGYDKNSLDSKFGITVTNSNISYLAYIEQKNVILLCERMVKNSSMNQHLNNITAFVKYLLILYKDSIQKTNVTILGLLINKHGNVEDLVGCKFCCLFTICSDEVFKSPINFDTWWDKIEAYEDWWHLENPVSGCKLFDDVSPQILFFVAMEEKGLPSLTDDVSLQLKQTYFLYTPQQLNLLFSDAKHVIIQGPYGSGKSIIGLKKLELIVKCCSTAEKIIYINFDRKSNLHFQMTKNVKEYLRVFSNQVKLINNIQQISESSDASVCVHHNSEGENLSTILKKTIKFKQTKFHMVVEEYDGEMLTHDEAANINELMENNDFEQCNVIILAQPLTKKRTWSVGKKSYKKETSMFHELKNTFRIVKLENVLRSSKEICGITKATQEYVRVNESVFMTDPQILKQRQQSEDDEVFAPFSNGPQDSKDLDSSKNTAELGTSSNTTLSYHHKNSNKTDKKHEDKVALDQAFEKITALRKGNLGKSSSQSSFLVSKFDFIGEPLPGVDIKGGIPKVVRFSENICSTSNKAVIFLALVLRRFVIRNKTNKTITLLYMTDEKPEILKRAMQLFPKLLPNVSYTDSIEEYLKKDRKSKMIFLSDFRSVNGMEFDHVVILLNSSEYYLKYYLPQAISRCTHDLNFVLLPREERNRESIRTIGSNQTVENIIDELKEKGLLEQVDVVECQKDSNCHSSADETDNKLVLHTCSYEYTTHMNDLKGKTESKFEEDHTTALAKAR